MEDEAVELEMVDLVSVKVEDVDLKLVEYEDDDWRVDELGREEMVEIGAETGTEGFSAARSTNNERIKINRHLEIRFFFETVVEGL